MAITQRLPHTPRNDVPRMEIPGPREKRVACPQCRWTGPRWVWAGGTKRSGLWLLLNHQRSEHG